MLAKRERLYLYFLLPSTAILVLVGLVPIFPVISYTLYEMSAYVPITYYVGLKNFKITLTDPSIQYSFAVTFFFTALSLAIQIPLGLLIALLISSPFRGREAFQVIFLLPLAIPPIAIGLAWQLLILPELGPIQYYILRGIFGIDYRYLADFWSAIVAILLATTWRWIPFVGLGLVPGLMAIPPDMVDSAKVDGATYWRVFRHIIMPLLKFPLMLVVFIRIMDCIGVFDEAWIMTQGGPGWNTRFISIEIVKKVIAESNFSLSAAETLLTLYIAMVLCWAILTLMKRGNLAGVE
jgi:ABC-type sugar transport system permease subunit